MVFRQKLSRLSRILLVVVLGLVCAGPAPLAAQAPDTAASSPWSVFAGVPPYTATMYVLDMADANEGWAAGAGGAMLHYTGGAWLPGMINTNGVIDSLDMVSASDGWAVTSVGEIYHYDGEAWTLNKKVEFIYLCNIYMLAANRGWATGNNGTIMSFNNGVWTESHVANVWLDAIDMLDAGSGWMAGSGVIYRWAGNGWGLHTQAPGIWFQDIDAVSATDAWAVGLNGAIYHFDGAAWGPFASPTTADLQGLSMVSATDGWAVGEDATLLHYDGAAWEIVPPPATVTDHLYDVQMLDADTGWIVGRLGVVLTFTGWPPDLSTSYETVSARRAMPGQTLTYTVHLVNSGGPAPSVVMTDTVPAGTTLVGTPTFSGGTLLSSNPFVLSLANMPGGSEVTFSFQATVNSGAAGCWPVFSAGKVRAGTEQFDLAAGTLVGNECIPSFVPLILKRD